MVIREALLSEGYGDPFNAGYRPEQRWGSYSTWMTVPAHLVAGAERGIPQSVRDAAEIAYALGATLVQVWAEDVEQVVRREVEDPPEPERAPSQWQQDCLPV